MGIIFLIMKDILRCLLITSITLIYIEIGPGGDYLGKVIYALINVLENIDWSLFFQDMGDNLDNLFISVSDIFARLLR